MDLVQTLSITDTIVGIGVGAVSAGAFLMPKRPPRVDKVNSVLRDYQTRYAKFDKQFNEYHDKSLLTRHNYIGQWPERKLPENIFVSRKIEQSIKYRDRMLELLNELDVQHVSKKRLQDIQKDLKTLVYDFDSALQTLKLYVNDADKKVTNAITYAEDLKKDYSSLSAKFNDLIKQMEKVKEKYDPLYISNVGPAYIHAKEWLAQYHYMIGNPPNAFLNLNEDSEYFWDKTPERARRAMDEFEAHLHHVENFQDSVFTATKVLRDHLKGFAKNDLMRYDKVMRIIVEAENHTYVSRNPQHELEQIITPAITILEA